MDSDFGFPKEYSFEVLAGLPGYGHIYQFHWEGKSTASEGVATKVVPESAEPWVGNFQRGDVRFSTVCGYPAKEKLCVVAGGQGYVVRANDPADYEVVRTYPILDVQALPEKRLIFFITFTDIDAYGAEGVIWESARISKDGITISEVTPDAIRGIAWDPTQGDVEFIVNVLTGQHEGGTQV